MKFVSNGKSLEWEWLKYNVGTVFFQESGIVSSDCCARNSDCEFVMAQTNWRFAKMFTVEGETNRLHDAI